VAALMKEGGPDMLGMKNEDGETPLHEGEDL
jgi:hypothetical protein